MSTTDTDTITGDMISEEGALALAKCEAAERFTTVLGHVRSEVYQEFHRAGLIHWKNGHRLTEEGRRVLREWRAAKEA